MKYIEPDAGPREQYFASTAGGIINLGSAGDYLLVVDRPVSRFTHLVFDAAGVLTDVDDFFNINSPDYTWDPVRERMYFLERGLGTDVVYETIDQSTGAITGRGRAGTNFGDFEDQAPIRVSNDGNRIITGAGDIVTVRDSNGEFHRCSACHPAAAVRHRPPDHHRPGQPGVPATYADWTLTRSNV